MRFFLIFILAVCFFTACDRSAFDPATRSGQIGLPAVADDQQLIVLTKPPAEPLIEVALTLGYSLDWVSPLNRLGDVLVSLRIPKGRSIPDAIEEIELASPSVTAGANHVYRIQTSSTDADDLFYANRLIGWSKDGCKAKRDVGMIDAGVPADHSGLKSGRIVQERFTESSNAPRTKHGALMAALLIGEGRLTNATLYSANVVDPNLGAGDRSDVVSILRATEWLSETGVEIVNVSLAGPRNKLLNRALGTATSQGMIFVTAAGNLGPEAPPQYPAAFPFTLAVTAVDRGLDVFPKAIQGLHIDLAAPGVDILVDNDSRTDIVSGTSAAAPFVSAILATEPDLNAKDVRSVLNKLGRTSIDLGDRGRDPVFGEGLVQAPDSCR